MNRVEALITISALTLSLASSKPKDTITNLISQANTAAFSDLSSTQIIGRTLIINISLSNSNFNP